MRTRIKELRARYNLTQDDLAKKVSVRRETILFIEKGNYNPSLKLAHEIAKALQTTIDELFIFEDTYDLVLSLYDSLSGFLKIRTEKSKKRVCDQCLFLRIETIPFILLFCSSLIPKIARNFIGWINSGKDFTSFHLIPRLQRRANYSLAI